MKEFQDRHPNTWAVFTRVVKSGVTSDQLLSWSLYILGKDFMDLTLEEAELCEKCIQVRIANQKKPPEKSYRDDSTMIPFQGPTFDTWSVKFHERSATYEIFSAGRGSHILTVNFEDMEKLATCLRSLVERTRW